MPREYKPRIADQLLRFKLRSKGAVLIEGSKWCGKTTTAKQVAGSTLYLADPATKSQNLTIAELDPTKLLTGATPRLIDEWQLAPTLWDAVRFEVDQRDEFGQFILTGSSTPADQSQIFHSGTGRFSWLKMRPMSLFESGESNGSVRLSQLFQSPATFTTTPNDFYQLDNLAFVTCRGGWPAATNLSGALALAQAYDYLDATLHNDISRADGIKRDPERMKKILRSYARLQGNPAPIETIIADISANESLEVSRNTATSYLEALKKIFVIEDSLAWNPNLRSKTAIRTSDTRYFVDPSIATAILGLDPASLLGDLHLFGFIFETLCIRDLRVYADALDATVYHYRDKRGLECDAVIVLRNGTYGLIEIKLGGDTLIEKGATNLTALTKDLQHPPAFQMILTGTSTYAYRRPDDILVIPIGCLRP